MRGDLWAEAAFTSAQLLWADPDPKLTDALGKARAELDHALRYAPHQAGAWLLLAGLESRQIPGSDPTEALKMSYYTGASERALIPLRLLVAAGSDAFGDTEVQQFVRRDLRPLLVQQQKSAVAEAYAGVSPVGRRFLEQAVGRDRSGLSRARDPALFACANWFSIS